MNQAADEPPLRFIADFRRALSRLETAPSFGKPGHQSQVLARAQKLLRTPAGIPYLFAEAPRFDAAGLFGGGDWANPETLQPALAGTTLRGGGLNATLECLSELRMLAVVEGTAVQPGLDAAAARDFLRRVLASNLDLLFPVATEITRDTDDYESQRVRALFGFILQRLGAGAILAELITEVERAMLVRPIMVQRAEDLLRAAGRALAEIEDDADPTVAIARHWIAALNGPSALAQSVSVENYATALLDCGADYLRAEAEVFGKAMRDTGLVSFQHADLLRHLVHYALDLLPVALALDSVGRASFDSHPFLVVDLIRFAIYRRTARSIYGLSRMLCAGTLFSRPVPPGLRRLMVLNVHPEVAKQLRDASEWQDPPAPNALLVAGTLSVLGQPRGVDQGDNPTCQSARAISLWAQNDVGYLLELIAVAARENELWMDFEGQLIRSSQLSDGMAKTLHTELDTVSLLLTPHIDRIYFDMGRKTIGRAGDGHRWVNPELHGWWVNRGFAELIDTASATIAHCDTFIRTFYAAYHPSYNGGRDMVYAQPCGIVTTGVGGEFVGLHAIAIQRVQADSQGAWRVYFFNPNREKSQNWGQDVVTSTHDHGELEGESSLPFEQFLSRLYVFHYKAPELGNIDHVPADAVAQVRAAIAASWGAHFKWSD